MSNCRHCANRLHEILGNEPRAVLTQLYKLNKNSMLSQKPQQPQLESASVDCDYCVEGDPRDSKSCPVSDSLLLENQHHYTVAQDVRSSRDLQLWIGSVLGHGSSTAAAEQQQQPTPSHQTHSSSHGDLGGGSGESRCMLGEEGGQGGGEEGVSDQSCQGEGNEKQDEQLQAKRQPPTDDHCEEMLKRLHSLLSFKFWSRTPRSKGKQGSPSAAAYMDNPYTKTLGHKVCFVTLHTWDFLSYLCCALPCIVLSCFTS